MRLQTLILALAFLTGVGNARAQTASITLWDAVLHLGISQDDLRAELAKHSLFRHANGMISNRPEGEGEGDIKGLYMYGGTMFSKEGKLIRVVKHLRPSPDSPDAAVAIASAIYETLQSITGASATPCRLHTSASPAAFYDIEPPIVPPLDRKETAIECDTSEATRGLHIIVGPLFLTSEHGVVRQPNVEIMETLDARYPVLAD
jgi:hypothetical protein